MTNPAEGNETKQHEQSSASESREDELDEYAHVDAETVLEDAVELFAAGSEPTPIGYPDDPPPADDDNPAR
jgi:hypothetical protein